jgi:hypothetical protein
VSSFNVAQFDALRKPAVFGKMKLEALVQHASEAY